MFVNVNGTRLHYVQEGQGTDLILIPGLGGSVHVWYAQLRALSSVCRVTAYDPRGHGRSAPAPGPYSIPQLADDLAGLMEALAIPRAVIVGSSMSALVALQFASQNAYRAQGLVLVGGFPTLTPAVRERMEERIRIAESEGMGPLVDLVVGTAFARITHQTQPALIGLYRLNLLQNHPRCYAASIRALLDADVTPLLAQVLTPTLVLLGDDEQVAPLPAARALAGEIPNARLRVIPNAGHLPFLEQPALFNAALLEFIGSL